MRASEAGRIGSAAGLTTWRVGEFYALRVAVGDGERRNVRFCG